MSQTESLESLLSVLGRTIIIVSMGIMARKFNWIPADTSALSVVVGKIALPAIFFLFAASLDLGSYDWAPITAIVITRIVMILLCGFIAWIWKMKPFFSAWGVMSFFVTQSNDIAIGIPIINALWDNNTTHFGDYAIIFSTLALLTSSLCIAFILIGETSRTTSARRENMEELTKNMTEKERLDEREHLHHHRSSQKDGARGQTSKDTECGNNLNSDLRHRTVSDGNGSKMRKSSSALSIHSMDGNVDDGDYRRMISHESGLSNDSMFSESNCWKVTKALLKNQLLLAVVLGGVVNVLCRSMGRTSIPPFFQELLHTMSSPFDFIALFLMGIGMAGKISIGTFFGRQALFPFVLVGIKLIVFPIVARGILTQLWSMSDLSGSGSYDDFQNFLFVYGVIPPAIAPVILAQSFNVMADRILNAMMMALLLTAPYMFLISLIIGVHTEENAQTLPNSINMVGEVMNIISILTGFLLLSACVIHKPWRRFPMPLIGILVLNQAMFSVFKLPCDYIHYTPVDMIGWIYAGNCFFRWTSHIACLVLSVLNAFSRTKPSLVWNHQRHWYTGTLISVLGAGMFGALMFELSPPDVAEWVSGYHTFCWLWYEPQMNVTIAGLSTGILIIAITLSVSAYYRMVPTQEVCKLKNECNLSQFIVKQHSDTMIITPQTGDDDDGDRENHKKYSSLNHSNLHSSLLGAAAGNCVAKETEVKLTNCGHGNVNGDDHTLQCVGDVTVQCFDAFYKAEIGIDFGFRSQCILILELLRMMLSLTFILWIKTDEGDGADQSFYLMELIARFVADAQAFITFLAFCVSEPFIAYLKFICDRMTCGAFRKSNPLAQAVGPSKYVLR